MSILKICVILLIDAVTADKEYRLRFEGLEFSNSSIRYVPHADVILYAEDENTTSISGTFVYEEALPDTSWVVLSGYEQNRNGDGYNSRETMNYSSNFCDLIENDDTVVPELRLFSNIPDACPVELKNYTVDRFIMDGDFLPDNIPADTEHWNFTAVIYEKKSIYSTVLASISAYIHFEPLEERNDDDNDNRDDNNDDNNNNDRH